MSAEGNHLPRRKAEPAVKKPSSRKKAYQNPEEQVKNLRKLVLRLSLALAVSLMLLIGTGYFAVVHLLESNQTFLPGQNYSTVDSTAGNPDA